jgi:CheY-like chemotaxis protein
MSLPNDGSTRLTEPRVLLICREPNLRRYMADVLALEDCAVQVAIDAEQGLKLLQRATEGWVVLMQLDPWEDMWELMRMLHKNPQLHAYHRIIQFDIAYCVDPAIWSQLVRRRGGLISRHFIRSRSRPGSFLPSTATDTRGIDPARDPLISLPFCPLPLGRDHRLCGSGDPDWPQDRRTSGW